MSSRNKSIGKKADVIEGRENLEQFFALMKLMKFQNTSVARLTRIRR